MNCENEVGPPVSTFSSTSVGPVTTWTSFAPQRRTLWELNPDVIVAVGGRVTPILTGLTHLIPIVIPTVADPVSRGYAKTLARPGHNATGFVTMELSVISKRSKR